MEEDGGERVENGRREEDLALTSVRLGYDMGSGGINPGVIVCEHQDTPA